MSATATRSRPKRVRPEQARALLGTEIAFAEAKAAFEAAKLKREEQRERLRDMVEPGEQLEVAGIRIKRTRKNTGRKFQLSEFLAKHKLTKSMEPFVTQPTTYEVWNVKALDE